MQKNSNERENQQDIEKQSRGFTTVAKKDFMVTHKCSTNKTKQQKNALYDATGKLHIINYLRQQFARKKVCINFFSPILLKFIVVVVFPFFYFLILLIATNKSIIFLPLSGDFKVCCASSCREDFFYPLY